MTHDDYANLAVILCVACAVACYLIMRIDRPRKP